MFIFTFFFYTFPRFSVLLFISPLSGICPYPRSLLGRGIFTPDNISEVCLTFSWKAWPEWTEDCSLSSVRCLFLFSGAELPGWPHGRTACTYRPFLLCIVLLNNVHRYSMYIWQYICFLIKKIIKTWTAEKLSWISKKKNKKPELIEEIIFLLQEPVQKTEGF